MIFRPISVSAHITLYLTICIDFHHEIYRYQPILHYYITLLAMVFAVRRISISTHITLIYHTLCNGFRCEMYIGISLYHTIVV